jgi:hypothetical protein
VSNHIGARLIAAQARVAPGIGYEQNHRRFQDLGVLGPDRSGILRARESIQYHRAVVCIEFFLFAFWSLIKTSPFN